MDYHLLKFICIFVGTGCMLYLGCFCILVMQRLFNKEKPMQVKTVIETYNIDHYYSAAIYSMETSDEAIAQKYADDYGFNVDDFEDKYEISVETVSTI